MESAGKRVPQTGQIRPFGTGAAGAGSGSLRWSSDASGVPVTGPAITERYAIDAATVISTFAPIGTHVVFAGAPVSGPTSAAVGRMNDLYREVAASHDGVWYADAGAAVLSDDSYTITLPCLSSEPCEGGYNSDGLPVNVVRAPDGVHFCPVSGDAVQGVTDNCPVWSSAMASR